MLEGAGSACVIWINRIANSLTLDFNQVACWCATQTATTCSRGRAHAIRVDL